MPTDDWQFWVVTGAAVVALGWLVRRVVPMPGRSRRQRGTRATLTVGGKTVETRHKAGKAKHKCH